MKICTKNPSYDINKWSNKYMLILKKEEDLSDNTLLLYKSVYDRFCEYVEMVSNTKQIKSIKDIDAYHITRFLEHSEELYAERIGENAFTYNHTTKKLYIIVLQLLFNYIEEKAEHEANGDKYSFEQEFKTLKKKKRGRNSGQASTLKHLNYDEVSSLVAHLDYSVEERGRHYDYIYSFCIKVMLYGGLRVSEALNIEDDDIEMYHSESNEEMLEVRLKDTKSGEEQRIPMRMVYLEKELAYLSSIKRVKSKKYVCNKSGKPTLDRSNLFRAVNRIYSDVGIEKSGLHILRHTAAMMLLDKTHDVSHVKQLLRHANINTTMIYVNRSVRELGEKVV